MNFYGEAVEKVKNAYTKYLLEENDSLFMERLQRADTPVVLFDSVLLGSCEILDEDYQYIEEGPNFCIVIGNVAINNHYGDVFTERRTKISVLCSYEGEDIKFASIHTSASRIRLIDEKQRLERELQYRNVMENMCDLLMELDVDQNTYYCNVNKYEELFKKKPDYSNVDEWFWDLCDNFVWPQDHEKLDIFRTNDIVKRLRDKVFMHDTTFRIKRVDSECVWIRLKVVFIPAINDASISKIYLLFEDITLEMNEKMRDEEFARKDYLTQLWNRRYTEELVEEAIKRDGKGVFVLVDVDRFKTINDTYGHMTGDSILIRVAANMKELINDGDIIGRLGGDEFVIFMPCISDEEASRAHIMDVMNATRFHYLEEDVDMHIHCSAGAVFFDSSELTFNDLYEAADKIMYEAKEAGRDRTNIGRI